MFALVPLIYSTEVYYTQNIESLGELRIDTPEMATFFKLLNVRIPQKVTSFRS
jgi:hypothetical protein